MKNKPKRLTLAQIMRGETWDSCKNEFTDEGFNAIAVLEAINNVKDPEFDPISLDGHGITLPC